MLSWLPNHNNADVLQGREVPRGTRHSSCIFLGAGAGAATCVLVRLLCNCSMTARAG